MNVDALQTPRLNLLPLNLDHIDAILEWANDPAVTGHSHFWRQPSDRKRVARFILEHEDDPSCAYWAAFGRTEGVAPEEASVGYVGNVFLFHLNRDYHHGQIGITIKQAAWNRGYAQEMMPAALRYGYRQLGMNKIYLQVFTTNTRALGLYRKLGFQDEGVLRAHYYVNGTYHDMHSLSLLRSEFEERYEKEGSLPTKPLP